MTVNIQFQETDSVQTIAAILTAADSGEALSEYERSVVESALTTMFEQDPALDPEEVNASAEELKAKLCN